MNKNKNHNKNDQNREDLKPNTSIGSMEVYFWRKQIAIPQNVGC